MKEGDVVISSIKKSSQGHHLVLFSDKIVICKKSGKEAKVQYKVLNEFPTQGTIHEDPAKGISYPLHGRSIAFVFLTFQHN